MAIKSTLRSEVSVVLSFDDAVKDGYPEYLENGFDESRLTLDGEPTRFVLQPLTYDQRNRANDIQGPSERVEFVLRCSLLRVTGYQVERQEGVVTALPPVEHEDSQQWKRPVVKREWLQLASLPTGVASELAAAARMLSEAAVPFCRRSELRSTPGDCSATSLPVAGQ